MLTRTRRQGNSVILTVPKKFAIPTGLDVEAKLVKTGILYKFVKEKAIIFDFREEFKQTK